MRVSRRCQLVFVSALLLGLLSGACAGEPSGQPSAAVQKEQKPASHIVVQHKVPVKPDVKPNLTNDPLKKDVEAGKLPPLDKRLPEKPVVVPLREAVGKYGGTIVTWHWHSNAGNLKMWLYDSLVRWKEDYSGYEPGLAEKYEWSQDGRVITYTLRKGLKWSDGKPFTTEDIRFWWEDLATYKDSGYSVPWWGRNKDGSPMEVKILNETQFQFVYKEPNWIQPFIIAQGFWEFEQMMKPKHYLSQFHPKYNKHYTDFRKLREKDNWIANPEFPTLFAWKTTEYKDGEKIVLERNPYYWKIDPEGNQLPYVDKIVALRVDDEEVRLLKALRGEFDLSFRGINPKNIGILMKNQDRGNYRVLKWSSGYGGWPLLMVNQDFVGDPYMRDLLRNKKFRQAISMAINRDNINEAIWNGMGTPQQATISKESPHFADAEGQKLFREWQKAYAEYDPETANKLLDEIGLNKKDANGFRLRPDGEPLVLTIDITSWCLPKVCEEAAPLIKRDLGAVGLKVELKNIPNPETDVRFRSAEWMLFTAAAELDVWAYPDWIFPVRGTRAWPLQGRWFETGGREGEKPADGSPARVLYDLYQKGRSLPDERARHKVVQEAVKYLIQEGPFYIGITGDIPEPVIARKNLRNVPEYGILMAWAAGSPGNLNIVTVFYDGA